MAKRKINDADSVSGSTSIDVEPIIPIDRGETEGDGTTTEGAEPAEQLRGFNVADPRDTRPSGGSGNASGQHRKRKLTAAERRKNRREYEQRKRESSSAPTPPSSAKTNKAVHLEGLEKLLLSVHVMGSAFLGIPELALAPIEAKTLAEAANEVLKHYNFEVDEKTAAWVSLTMAGVGIYGTRITAYTQRIKREEAERRRTLPAPEPTPMPGVQVGTPPPAANAAPRPPATPPPAPLNGVMDQHLRRPPAMD